LISFRGGAKGCNDAYCGSQERRLCPYLAQGNVRGKNTMEIKIQVFKEVCQTVFGGFQRDHTPRYEICGGDRTLISLLGTNGRCWERAQVGGKIQSRTSNVAGFQVSGRWLRSITNCCVLRRTCAILDFERSGCSRVTILTISMLDTLEDFQTFLDLFFPSEQLASERNQHG
jgi:hypothetical protein